MAIDLTVFLEDRPGTLAELSETLGRAGINIEGGCSFPCEGKGEIHILVVDPAAARRLLKDAGIEVQAEREVLVKKITNQPGGLGKLTRRLAAAGVNVDLLYLDIKGHVVLGVDNLERGQQVL